MKKALCVKNFDEISTLVSGNSEHVETHMVDRDICENPENGYLQLIPYVTFYSVNIEEGKLAILQYKRPDTTEGEERLAGKTSIGFGGHVDSDEDIVSEETITNEDGSTSYKMTLQNLIDTLGNAAKREVQEELEIDLTDYFDLANTKQESAFFSGNPAEEVNQVHLGFSTQVKITEEEYNKLKESYKFREEEIEQIDTLGIRLNNIIESMDISRVINHITQDLMEKHSLEDWSGKIFNYIAIKEINNILTEVTYEDLVDIIKAKKIVWKNTV